VVAVPLFQLQLVLSTWADLSGEVASAAAMSAGALAMFWLFGWVSRRFERQADTFAAHHLSTSWDPNDAQTGTITAEAAATVCSALETIARLNAVTPRRRSWRHGSIAWRQAYLQTLVGQPLARLPIDRQIRLVRVAAVMALAAGVAWGVARGVAASGGTDSGARRSRVESSERSFGDFRTDDSAEAASLSVPPTS
jgi:hypothetical protein